MRLANLMPGPWSTGGKPSIVETHPHLVAEFVDVVDQPTRTPDTITAGQRLMVNWRCSKGHVYPALILNRKHGRGCGPCKRGEPGPGDDPGAVMFRGRARLRDVRPDLRDEFMGMVEAPFFTFDEVSAALQKKAWWRCRDCQHEFATTIGNRYNHNTRCPACAEKMAGVVEAADSLAVKFPELGAEFLELVGAPHRTALDVSPSSSFSARWRCSTCSFEWTNNIGNRTYFKLKSGCPRCVNATHYLFPGDSLAERNPALAAELVTIFDRKGGVTTLTASEVRAASARRALWRCSLPGCGHQWKAGIAGRYTRKSGCPRCVVPLHSSAVETRLACELASFPSLAFDVDAGEVEVTGAKRLQHCDAAIPHLKLVVEYDGNRWHEDKQERDRVKTDLLENDGWKVLRVRERPLEPVSSWSLSVAKKNKPKALADLVATELAAKGFIPNEELEEYLALSDVRAGEHAEEVLLRRRIKRVRGMKDKQSTETQ